MIAKDEQVKLSFAQYLQLRREQSGMSHEQFSRYVKVSPATLYKMLKGDHVSTASIKVALQELRTSWEDVHALKESNLKTQVIFAMKKLEESGKFKPSAPKLIVSNPPVLTLEKVCEYMDTLLEKCYAFNDEDDLEKLIKSEALTRLNLAKSALKSAKILEKLLKD